MEITWDEPKRLATLAGRSLDFAMVTEAFFASAKVVPAREGRFLAIGLIGTRAYAVIFKPLGSEAVSLISLRVATKKERAIL